MSSFTNNIGNYTNDPSIIGTDGSYIGIVVDNSDPKKIGRCRIRSARLHGPKVADEDIPWAFPKYPVFFGKNGHAGAVSIPKKGAVVRFFIHNDDPQSLEYEYMMGLADDVRDLLGNEYDGVHVFGADGDEDFRMYFTPKTGFNIYYRDSFINIAPDNAITIHHADSKSMTEMRGGVITTTADSQINRTAGTSIHDVSQECWYDGKVTKVGHNPYYSAVLGEPLMTALKAMASIIDVKLYPTPNVTKSIVDKLEKVVLSDTVKISK